MKKILLLLITLVLFQNVSLADTKGVSFIYINGANNNDAKMKAWFINGVKKLHPVMKSQFEKNADVNKLFLKNGKYAIKEEPAIFFWGDKSANELNFVHDKLDIAKAFTLSNEVRELLAAYLHDAVWVQKSHNMIPILDNLNEVVKNEHAKGNDVVLYGYSAGSFVAYEYLFGKLAYINIKTLFEHAKVSEELAAFIEANPRKKTCISALAKGKLGVITSDGKVLLDINEDRLKQNYLKMDEATNVACAPEGALKGIINFASPLVLFYSDIANPDYELTYYNKYMLKHIMENDMFWLTVNYREDPLGFPVSGNLTVKEMEKSAGFEVVSPSGFVFDNSGTWAKRPFLVAHTSYWTTRKTFSNAVVKTYVDGYKFQYDQEFQEKMLKNRKNNK